VYYQEIQANKNMLSKAVEIHHNKNSISYQNNFKSQTSKIDTTKICLSRKLKWIEWVVLTRKVAIREFI
jgi:hypothetical protein